MPRRLPKSWPSLRWQSSAKLRPLVAEEFSIPHFWVANIGAVLLTVGIYTQMVPLPSLAFIVISGSLFTILGMVLFAGIVYSKV